MQEGNSLSKTDVLDRIDFLLLEVEQYPKLDKTVFADGMWFALKTLRKEIEEL